MLFSEHKHSQPKLLGIGRHRGTSTTTQMPFRKITMSQAQSGYSIRSTFWNGILFRLFVPPTTTPGALTKQARASLKNVMRSVRSSCLEIIPTGEEQRASEQCNPSNNLFPLGKRLIVDSSEVVDCECECSVDGIVEKSHQPTSVLTNEDERSN